MIPFPNIELAANDFREFDWENIIAQSEEKDCSAYSRLLFRRAKELEAEDDAKGCEICILLGILTSLNPRLDTPEEPYQPLLRSDIPQGHLEALLAIVSEIKEPDIRARVADILWVIKKGDFQVAKLAIDAYLESAARLENPEQWVPTAERIERALQLSRQLGRKAEPYRTVISYIEIVLDKYDGEDPLWFSCRLMSLLLDVGEGDPGRYAQLAQKSAIRAETARCWRRARDYWEIKAQWHAREGDVENEYEAHLAAAETYISEAIDHLEAKHPDYGVAAHHLTAAVEALRRISAPRERVNEVHAMLSECQQMSVGQLKLVSETIDITSLVNQAQAGVKGKTARDAILSLAAMCAPICAVNQLRDEVTASQEQFVFYSLFPLAQIDALGRVTAIRPPLPPNLDETSETPIRLEMFRHATLYQGLQAEATIAPALKQINSEHHLRLDNLREFVINNPFVPPGREVIFARGLLAGFTGDFLVAAHFLVPQYEASIRHLLNQRGVITTTFDSQGVQRERSLGALLYMPELKDVLGPDLLFDLQGLLIQPLGSNLRNRLAHGLMDATEFPSRPVIYLWGLTLYICCFPALARSARLNSPGDIRGLDDSEGVQNE